MANKEIGRIGQRRYGGTIYEEFLHELRGTRGIEVYREMSENDDVVGAILFAIEMLVRQCDWNVEPGGDTAKDKEAAEFVESCMHDMQDTWTDTISEILSFLTYGWSFHEIVYKRRMGNTKNPTTKSKYTDGLIGWKKLPIRAQETLYRWEYDNEDNLLGMTQMPPPDFGTYTIPMSKALLFRTKSRKNNPEGRSILRNAYRSWYFKRRIQEIEGIGIERDLAGLPVMHGPEGLDLWNDAAARLNDNIEKAQTAAGKPAGEGDDPEVDTEDKKDQGKKKQSKGDNEDMKIDKSKMTQAELLILEDIEKRYGVADDPAQTEQTPEGKPAVTKSVEKPEQNQETPADGEDIYKGLNPAVKAEIEALRKFREDAENRELEAVAGKYEIIGKKKEELVPMLKSLRATGGTAYNDMIAVLDATVEAVNKSGVFSEVGKSGHGSAHVSDAEGKIEGIAKSYMQKEPSMSYTDALAKAWEDNPDLMDAYDAEEGF